MEEKTKEVHQCKSSGIPVAPEVQVEAEILHEVENEGQWVIRGRTPSDERNYVLVFEAAPRKHFFVEPLLGYPQRRGCIAGVNHLRRRSASGLRMSSIGKTLSQLCAGRFCPPRRLPCRQQRQETVRRHRGFLDPTVRNLWGVIPEDETIGQRTPLVEIQPLLGATTRICEPHRPLQGGF